MTGRLDDAVTTYERGAIHQPFNPALYTNLGAAYGSRGEYGAALQTLERSLDLATFPLPRLHLTYTNLALVHFREGRRQEARKALKNALRAFPNYGPARRSLETLTSTSGERLLLQDEASG